jgi:starvation-inducible DNA-binding protein
MRIDIGIDETQREQIASGLSELLADSYTLYVKTHNFHWNVTGPMFRTLHLMFEEQYTELATAVDTLAERIRALGVYAPGSLTQFKELATVEEETGVPNAEHMLQQLVEDHETVVRTARRALPTAEQADDEATVDLLVARMRVHEKTAWMLRSMLTESPVLMPTS